MEEPVRHPEAFPSPDVAAPAEVHERALSADERPWLAAHRWGFRLAFAYLALAVLPFPFDAPPGADFVDRAYDALWGGVTNALAKHLLHVHTPLVSPNGSGDTTYNWIQQTCLAILSLFIVGVWGVVDRKRPHYRVLNEWLRTCLRFSVSWVMLSYGQIKLLHQQMPWVPERLIEPYGEFSPMGVLWSTIGLSPVYSAFAGGAEYLSGLLLLFRRTASLGGLLGAIVMTNVVVMNFCFDVPVKIFSSQLLLMSLFIAAPDIGRVARAVLSEAAVPARPSVTLLRRPLTLRVAQASFLLWLVYAAYEHVYAPLSRAHNAPTSRETTPTSGLYQVEEFHPAEVKGGEVPAVDVGGRPVLNGAWARVAIGQRTMAVLFADGSYARYFLEPAKDSSPTLKVGRTKGALIHYQKPDANHLILEAADEVRHVMIRLRRLEDRDFPLRSTGFRLIQEFPRNL